MSKKAKPHKHKNTPESQSANYRSSLAGTMTFGFKHMFLALVVGMAIGGFVGYEVASTHMVVSAGAGGPTDAYGRSVGHPHYGHDHP